MATYKVIVRKSAAKQIKKLPKVILKSVLQKISALADNPRPDGCTKLVGSENLWRVRTGDYRIVYSIEDEKLIVEIIRVKHRKDVYE